MILIVIFKHSFHMHITFDLFLKKKLQIDHFNTNYIYIFNRIAFNIWSAISMSHKVICNEFFERKHSFSSMFITIISDIYENILWPPSCVIWWKIKLLYLLPFWQYLPKYPGLQVHFHLWPTLTQVPPFWHPLKTHATARSI